MYLFEEQIHHSHYKCKVQHILLIWSCISGTVMSMVPARWEEWRSALC